jgi:hypothetical protein
LRAASASEAAAVSVMKKCRSSVEIKVKLSGSLVGLVKQAH